MVSFTESKWQPTYPLIFWVTENRGSLVAIHPFTFGVFPW